MSLEDLKASLDILKEKEKKQLSLINQLKDEIDKYNVTIHDWEEIRENIPSWHDMLLNADIQTKRVLINKLVNRIEITKDEVKIHFKVNVNDFFQQPRISGGFEVPK